ncbi:bifunctional hydroxymethylpyrimidine kinase/phosphomethylpyrimidine kinase [Luteipulveratus sp. YIM 133132]|uniref:bifunctional hydroxymethylpyrimidine kinase/phosphomethylpyrimidine kinase n=1 Tax=Luteipulveratus flavus TaxID=3031728 RepID=UPI0023AEB0B5|nr:bifunctional hydroxymethylpyrimidine kinase/phosphomethylpyrimidine kinase [Luteipulveratus sp. YIM 133132]MDE9366108.1 bifunctional hydroxymethylpyrimidine kinase/phosphomethylpyrimidine kinase [Luteipulveratus sp. YIM 133132]
MSGAPVALSVAGSDPSGGAGIQADLKTFSALGAYGCAAVTALTAQSTQGVTGVHVVPAPFVREQVETLIADVALDAVKIGMLATAEVADEVGGLIRRGLGAPVVLDPVMVSTSGSRLLDQDAMDAVRRLVPLADVVTPNLHEAAALLDAPVATDPAEMRAQAEQLRARVGARRVLLKGGHATGDDAVDVWSDGDRVVELSHPRIHTENTHGTGCSLSSAIAALRPAHDDWLPAVQAAKAWLTGALRAADWLSVGHGPGPVHHFHALWPVKSDSP